MKTNKLIKWAKITIILSVVVAIVAFASGAGRADTWIEANKTLRVAQGLHAEPIAMTAYLDGVANNLTINTSSSVLIRHGDVEKITVEYYEDYEGQSVARIERDALIIQKTYKSHWLNMDFDFLVNPNANNVAITLPLGTAFNESKIDTSSGTVDIDGIALGKTDIDVSSGKVLLNNCVITEIEEIETSSGTVKITGGSINSLKEIDVSSGVVEVENVLNGGNIELSTSSGSIKLKNSQFKNMEIDISSGLVELSSCIVLGSFTAELSSGEVSFKDGTINGRVKGELSSGDITLDNVNGAKEYEFKISSGTVNLLNLDVKFDRVATNLNISSGTASINGKRCDEGKSHHSSYDIMIVARISSGRLNITTK